MTQAEIEKKVKKVIDKVRPYLVRDGGDCEIVKIENGIVYVRMLGACVGCSSIDLTLKDGIEAILLGPTAIIGFFTPNNSSVQLLVFAKKSKLINCILLICPALL